MHLATHKIIINTSNSLLGKVYEIWEQYTVYVKSFEAEKFHRFHR